MISVTLTRYTTSKQFYKEVMNSAHRIDATTFKLCTRPSTGETHSLNSENLAAYAKSSDPIHKSRSAKGVTWYYLTSSTLYVAGRRHLVLCCKAAPFIMLKGVTLHYAKEQPCTLLERVGLARMLEVVGLGRVLKGVDLAMYW